MTPYNIVSNASPERQLFFSEKFYQLYISKMPGNESLVGLNCLKSQQVNGAIDSVI